MMKLGRFRVIIGVLVIFLFIGCSAKKYSFTIEAPPKYSTGYVFDTMGVQTFESNRKQFGNTIVTLLKSGVAKEGYVRIVSKGAECILTGTLYIGDIHKDSRTKKFECTKYSNNKSYKTTCHTYYYTKKVMIKADYTLYSNKDKNVVFGDSVSYDFDKTWSSSENSSAARTSALTDDQIINKAMQDIALQIVQAITPHKETVSRELQKGGDDNIELGITYLINGRVDQAISIWDQCISVLTSPKNKAAAYYNIGVVKESQGLYRDAFELYSKANVLLPAEELYIQSNDQG